MTTAERIIDRLNEYEQEHASDRAGSNVWDEVIWALAGKDLNEEATQAEDPAYQSTIAVFRDGSAVRWLEDEGRWVCEVPT